MNRRSLLQNLGLTLGSFAIPTVGKASTSSPEKPYRIAHITDVHMMPLIGAAKGFARCLDHIQSLPHKPDLIAQPVYVANFGQNQGTGLSGMLGRRRFRWSR